MIHPDTYVDTTAKGLSLFAKRQFRKGEIIWIADKKTDRILAPKTYQSLPTPVKESMNTIGYMDYNGRFVIPGDNGKYINHSCDSNCTFLLEFDNISVARRHIGPGEEITENYLSYYRHLESFRCKCGHPNCVGSLSMEDRFRPCLRSTFKDLAISILNQPQPLLAVEFDEKNKFLKALNRHSYEWSKPQDFLDRLVHNFPMELAFPAAAH